MEDTYLVLLSADENSTIHALCDELDIEYEDKPFITIRKCDDLITFYVVSKQQGNGTAEFFHRQTKALYEYFQTVDSESVQIKEAVLRQIETTSSMVIVEYSYESEETGLDLLAQDVVTKLLEQLPGLCVSSLGCHSR